MKTLITKFVFPFGIGLALSTITILGIISAAATGCQKAEDYCTSDPLYPLYCPVSKKCCPAGYSYSCDGQCYQSGCPNGTVNSGRCSQ